MPNQRTFSEIFREFYDANPTENFNAGWESSLEPAWIAQLIASLPPIKSIYRPLYIYQKNKTTQRQPHFYSEIQMQAFQSLNQFLVSPLQLGFYSSELKSAYRQALLKTHPDQGGSAETFQQVRKCYEILKPLVTK